MFLEFSQKWHFPNMHYYLSAQTLKVYESLKRSLFDILYCLPKITKQMKEIIMLPLITARFDFSCFVAIEIENFVEILCRKVTV